MARIMTCILLDEGETLQDIDLGTCHAAELVVRIPRGQVMEIDIIKSRYTIQGRWKWDRRFTPEELR